MKVVKPGLFAGIARAVELRHSRFSTENFMERDGTAAKSTVTGAARTGKSSESWLSRGRPMRWRLWRKTLRVVLASW